MDRPDPGGLTPDRLAAECAGLVARCTFAGSGPLRCGVSGGADSLALLALAVAVRGDGREVTAVHVDHGLRPGSEREADRVAAVAEAVGARFESRTVTVVDGPNLEARARDARHRALGPDACTGHTADDRAETMLLNLVRGAGPAGLGALRRGARHPILDLRRVETEALCDRLGFDVLHDPSNTDPRFARNRVRHEVLPLLAGLADRDVVAVLARQGDRFAEVDELLASLAAAVDPTVTTDLVAAPPAVAATAVRRWLVDTGATDGHPPASAAVERVLAVARGEAVATEVGRGRRVARRAGRLRVEVAGDGSGAGSPPCKDAAHG